MNFVKLFSLGILISLLLPACNETNESDDDRPNILLIISEDTSQDLGCYGNFIVHTPNLDRLAQNGVIFSNAYTTYSICSPARSSIFTGLYPHQNGQIGWATHYYTMYDDIKVLPQYLKEAGYSTGILGKIHVNPEERFNFDFRAIPGPNFAKEKLDQYASNAKKFIREFATDKPYFLMVNFPDAHLPLQNDVDGLPTIKVDAVKITNTLPFVGINTSRLRIETEKYYNCVNRLDESVGMLLDSIGDLSNTCIIYAGDHGAQFPRGKGSSYEGGLKVPFIIQYKEKINTQSITRNELVSFIDILPTILDIAGEKIPEGLPGKSLLTLFDNNYDQCSWRKYIGADNEGGSPIHYFPQRSLRGKRYKIIQTINVGRSNYRRSTFGRSPLPSTADINEINKLQTKQKAYKILIDPPEWELYDLGNDPWEFDNLAEDSSYDNILKQMQDAMMEWRQQTNDPFLDKDKLERFTHEMDSINLLYPNYSYRKVENFKWQYPEYLNK